MRSVCRAGSAAVISGGGLAAGGGAAESKAAATRLHTADTHLRWKMGHDTGCHVTWEKVHSYHWLSCLRRPLYTAVSLNVGHFSTNAKPSATRSSSINNCRVIRQTVKAAAAPHTHPPAHRPQRLICETRRNPSSMIRWPQTARAAPGTRVTLARSTRRARANLRLRHEAVAVGLAVPQRTARVLNTLRGASYGGTGGTRESSVRVYGGRGGLGFRV
jgi:hypothetical protein